MPDLLCGECKSRSPEIAPACPSCGGTTLYHVKADAVISIPAGTACSNCAWSVFDRQVDGFNHKADAYNDALHLCSS